MRSLPFARSASALLGGLACAGLYVACTDYLEPPRLEPTPPVLAVIDEDAESPRLASPEAGGEPARDGGGRLVTDASIEAGPTYPVPPPLTGGHVYYTRETHVYRIDATPGAVPVSVSERLDAFGEAGDDQRLTASLDGRWMLVDSARFGCGTTACLVLVPNDFSHVEVVRPGGRVFTPEGVSAISSGAGDLIVYPASNGPHLVDLFATRRRGTGVYSDAVLLTGASTYPYNNMPAITFNGTKVSFDCGQNPFPETGNNDACEVNVDGTGFRRLVSATTLPNPRQTHVQNPHWGLDGLLFEAAWPVDSGDPEIVLRPEIIWRLPSDGGLPVPHQVFDNSVSPCALPDGRYAFLWLAGPGNVRGDHELSIANREATSAFVLTPRVEITDVGLGCSD